MTAMMAFFLVLWIINATDKDTKTLIARYFNPVKLEESVADAQEHSWRRLATPAVERRRKSDGEAEAAWPEPAPPRRRTSRRAPPPTAGQQARRQAAERGGQPRRSGESQGEHDRGRAVRRPLPQSRHHRRADLARRARDHAARRGERRARPNDGLADPFRSAARQAAPEPRRTSRRSRRAVEAAPSPRRRAPARRRPPTTTRQAAGRRRAPPPPPPSRSRRAAAAARLQKDLELQIAPPGARGSGPAIDVKATDEGLLISLTDKLYFSMFAIGSAEPQPQVMQAMDAIAAS